MLYFPCNTWIASPSNDTCAEATLEPVLRDPRVRQTAYHVVTQTANTRGAGTDADVYINISGTTAASSAATGWLQLLARGLDDFERGGVDRFSVTGPDVSKIQRVRLGLDPRGTGAAAAWKCEWVRVAHVSSGHVVHFNCGTWLSPPGGSGWVEVELLPAEGEGRAKQVEYTWTVYTDDEQVGVLGVGSAGS